MDCEARMLLMCVVLQSMWMVMGRLDLCKFNFDISIGDLPDPFPWLFSM